MASKLGGLNDRNDDAHEIDPCSEVAEQIVVVADPFTFLGEGRRCEGRNGRMHLTRPPWYRSRHPGKDSWRITSGTAHLQQGLSNNLQRPVV